MQIKTVLFYMVTAVVTFMMGIGASSGIFFLESLLSQPANASEAPGFGVATKTARSDKFSKISPVSSVSISGSGLEVERAGKYHLDQNFDGEFADFETIDVSASAFTFDADGNLKAPYTAIIRGTAISLESITIEGDKIAFKTAAVRGTSYIFAGSFRNKSRCGIDVDTLGIDGTLIKVKDGALTAVMSVNFHLVCGC